MQKENQEIEIIRKSEEIRVENISIEKKNLNSLSNKLESILKSCNKLKRNSK
jgi:hypothetical protein